ncbi:MAG: hypothetical protein ACI4KM_10010 [Oscillospiraceae bacterium]
MKRFLYTAGQLAWGLPQTLAGFIVFLLNITSTHYVHRGAVVTEWRRSDGLSLGLFVFVGAAQDKHCKSDTLAHEYGHTIQSLILGPLYLAAVGLPSIIWAGLPCFINLRRKRGIPYSRLYCEGWADRLGKSSQEV